MEMTILLFSAVLFLHVTNGKKCIVFHIFFTDQITFYSGPVSFGGGGSYSVSNVKCLLHIRQF